MIPTTSTSTSCMPTKLTCLDTWFLPGSVILGGCGTIKEVNTVKKKQVSGIRPWGYYLQFSFTLSSLLLLYWDGNTLPQVSMTLTIVMSPSPSDCKVVKQTLPPNVASYRTFGHINIASNECKVCIESHFLCKTGRLGHENSWTASGRVTVSQKTHGYSSLYRRFSIEIST